MASHDRRLPGHRDLFLAGILDRGASVVDQPLLSVLAMAQTSDKIANDNCLSSYGIIWTDTLIGDNIFLDETFS